MTTKHKPEQYAGCYSLDLYCDSASSTEPNFETRDGVHTWRENFPHNFVGERFAECAKEAHGLGWKIHRTTRTATCPKCSKGRKQNGQD